MLRRLLLSLSIVVLICLALCGIYYIGVFSIPYIPQRYIVVQEHGYIVVWCVGFFVALCSILVIGLWVVGIYEWIKWVILGDE